MGFFKLALLLGVGIAVAIVFLVGGFIGKCSDCHDIPWSPSIISTTTVTPTTPSPRSTTLHPTTVTPTTSSPTTVTLTTPSPTTVTPTTTRPTTDTPTTVTPTTTNSQTSTPFSTTSSHTATPTSSPKPNSLHFNVFTLRSLQTFCKTNKNGICFPVGSYHSIPQANLSIVNLSTGSITKKRILTNCHTNEIFNIEKFSESTIRKLSLRWAASYENVRDKNIKFWKQQRKTYGTCTGKHLIEYFKTGLTLADKFQIDRWFLKSKIYPSNNRTYSVQNFTKSLAKHNIKKNQFVLTCQMVGNKQWLDRISLCFSNIFKPINCHFLKSNCTKSLPIYFVHNYTLPVGGRKNEF